MKFSGMVVSSANLTLKRARPRTLELEVVAELPFSGEQVTMAFDVNQDDVDHMARICALARGL